MQLTRHKQIALLPVESFNSLEFAVSAYLFHPRCNMDAPLDFVYVIVYVIVCKLIIANFSPRVNVQFAKYLLLIFVTYAKISVIFLTLDFHHLSYPHAFCSS